MTQRAPPYEERRLPAAPPPPGGRGGQADLDLCGPVNSFQWTRERPDHTGLGFLLLTARGERGADT